MAPLINKAFSDQKRIFVPITDSVNNTIYLSEIFEDSAYTTGAFGIKEPDVYKRQIRYGIQSEQIQSGYHNLFDKYENREIAGVDFGQLFDYFRI